MFILTSIYQATHNKSRVTLLTLFLNSIFTYLEHLDGKKETLNTKTLMTQCKQLNLKGFVFTLQEHADLQFL